MTSSITLRPAIPDDLPCVVALDEANTGLAKPDYWQDAFIRYSESPAAHFLIAEIEGRFAGFLIGEVRAWEFGSPPCGWVFALGVQPEFRTQGIGTALFEAACNAFRKSGVAQVRTMLSRDDHLNMAFFRSQGMVAGPFLQLELDLESA
ncbi:MAG: N-acetyltransferase [SAR324 cluster bacterium]|nr:N-acetyltransferase [SAR324 cluster bacterium]